MPYQIPSLAGEPYRPSNGTEGEMFMDQFCRQCIHDMTKEGCLLILLSMFHDTDEKEYPKEWCHNENGEPICTQFERKETA